MKQKIPFYNIANMFFTGTVFTTISLILIYDKLEFTDKFKDVLNYCKDWSVIIGVAILVIMFEVGFLLNKISSVVLAPLLEKKIWPKKSYDINVSILERKNSKFRILNIELHVVRTHILMYILLSIISIITAKWITLIFFILFTIMFVFAGVRTNKFMNKIKEDFENTSNK